MANYKMIVQYEGSRYCGWQVQNSTQNTIQGILERTLERMLAEEIEVIGSGRTDAGVHARGQSANFHCKNHIEDLPCFLTELNSHLPEDIGVVLLEEVDERFHARFSAKEKTYVYRIYTGQLHDVFNRKFQYNYTDRPLDITAMRDAASKLTGTHDFRAFCGNKNMKKSTVRTIYHIDITVGGTDAAADTNAAAAAQSEYITISYTGDGFLQNMVRILTGTLIEVGTGSIAVDSVPGILESKDRSRAGFTAPAEGLCLESVSYS